MSYYAKLDENNNIAEVKQIIGDFPEDQMVSEGYYHYEYIIDIQYDSATQKIDGTEVVVDGTKVTVRPKVVLKTSQDIYQDKLEQRRLSILSSTERIEVMAPVIDKIIEWIDLRAIPGDPTSISKITDEERTFIKRLVSQVSSKILPTKP
jgi:hypothetical protein